MRNEGSSTRVAVAVLTLVLALGLPVGLLTTYPSEEQAGFAGVVELVFLVLTLSISAWTIFLAVALPSKRPWARWPAAFNLLHARGHCCSAACRRGTDG